MPLLALLTSSIYLVLSRLYSLSPAPVVPFTRHKPSLYLLSAGLTLSIVPYTILFMRQSINGLERAGQVLRITRADELETTKVVEGKTTKQLVDEWGMLNLGRAVLTGLGFLVGIWGSIVPLKEVIVEVGG